MLRTVPRLIHTDIRETDNVRTLFSHKQTHVHAHVLVLDLCGWIAFIKFSS